MKGSLRERHAIPSVRSALLYPRGGPEARHAASTAASWLIAHGIEVAVLREVPAARGAATREAPTIAPDEIDRRFDLAIALGGDGTLLRAARWVADHGIPVMGINLGHLGFLAAYSAPSLVDALQAAADGRLVWEARLRMKVSVRREDDEIARENGCNDCYVKHGELPRMLRMCTTIGGAKMADYRADGIIVCTPMGSTAYNLAAGGPIVEPGTDTFTITPICPHSLTHRPVVTSANEPIGIAYLGPHEAGPATLSVDGQWSVPLQVGDEVEITRADRPLQLVPPQSTVYEVLGHKLGWSAPGLA
jgi:NAD+ kinase